MKGTSDFEDGAFGVLVPKALDEEYQQRVERFDLRTLPEAKRPRDGMGMMSGEFRSGLPSLSF